MLASVRRSTGFDRILLVLGALLALGFLATTLISYYVSKREIHAAIVERELPLTSDTVYSEIQKDLVRPVQISSMMASDTFLRDWVLGGERDVAKMTKYLNEVMTRYGAFTSFFISENTANYYHTTGLLRKMDPDNPINVWYYRVRGLSEPYEINVDTDQANQNRLTIFINYRVFDYSGRFIGVTGVGLTVDAVRHLLGEYQQRYKRNVYFVDTKGQVILFGAKPFKDASNIQQVEGLRDIADSVFAGKHGSYQYRNQGRNHLLNVRYLPELKWYLFVEKTEDDALVDVRATLYLNLAICVLFMAAILFLAAKTLRRYQSRLEEMATVDKLSGLLNRQAGEVLLSHALADTRRSRAALTAVLFDVDYFKSVNDHHGHSSGDRVIQQMATLIKANQRESDIAIRWGGDEFLLLLKNCDGAKGLAIAEKLRTAVASVPFELDDKPLPVSISIGIAEALASDTPESLLERADRSLYAAKHAGRNRAVLAAELGYAT